MSNDPRRCESGGGAEQREVEAPSEPHSCRAARPRGGEQWREIQHRPNCGEDVARAWMQSIAEPQMTTLVADANLQN
jgi:hypothetical protein